MPSKSKSQQRFFGMVDAYKKGELKNPSKKIKKAANGMSMGDVKDFAETKHNKLPEKVKENKNINKKLIKLTESDLHQIVKESVNRVLREKSRDIDDDNYFGGGLPNRYFDDDAPDDDRISQKQIGQLDNIANTIAEIANNTNDDTELLFQAVDCIDKFTSRYK